MSFDATLDKYHFRSMRAKLQAFAAIFWLRQPTNLKIERPKMTKKKQTKPSCTSGFAILENALRITYVIIKIVIAIVVPSGKHIYDPGVII